MPPPNDAKFKKQTTERDFEREYELDCYVEMFALFAQFSGADSSDSDE